MKTIKFRAILSGDHECFCFAVTRYRYKKITGKYPDKYAKSDFHKNKYNIYMSDLTGFWLAQEEREIEFSYEILRKDKAIQKKYGKGML